jgi:hypothetical protein
MKEEIIVHTGGASLGLILLIFGIMYKLPGYIYPGFLWFIVNLFFLLNDEHKIKLNVNKHLFAFLFMAFPALVMGPIVITATYKYNHQYLRYFVLFVILVDLWHLFLESKEVFLICIVLFLVVRQLRCVGYDDVHQNITQNYKYIDKSDMLFVIPKFENVPLTDNMNFVQKIKNKNKILGMHGVTHSPEGIFTKAEFGYPVKEETIKEGMDIFENAFGYKPKYFKAPCYNLLPENQIKIEKLGMKVVGPETAIFNRLLHPPTDNVFITIINYINNYV